MAAQHRLAVPDRIDDVAEIADSLVALHCTDPASMYLSAAARMVSPSVQRTDAALHESRTVVRHHGMRRTLWVCTPVVARTVHAATTIDIAVNEWRQVRKWVAAAQMADPEGWLDDKRAATLDALHRRGPVSARQLGKMEPELTGKIVMGGGKYAAEQSIHTRLLLLLGFDAAAVRTTSTGSWVSGEYLWSLTSDWLGHELTGHDPVAARDDLAARYLHAFGPVTTVDLQWWAGWTMGTTKAALASIGATAVAIDGGSTGWMLPADAAALDRPTLDDEPWVALLPGLDPTIMGWKQRDWYLGEWATFGGPLFDTNGNAGPTVWVNGEAIGAWAQRADGSVVHELLRPVDGATRRKIAVAADELRAVIGDARVTPRFPAPLQKSLAVG